MQSKQARVDAINMEIIKHAVQYKAWGVSKDDSGNHIDGLTDMRKKAL